MRERVNALAGLLDSARAVGGTELQVALPGTLPDSNLHGREV